MRIEKKILPRFFEKVLSGEKTFELRLADFECTPGDILVLQEWNSEEQTYTGRQIEKEVTYVLKTKDVDFWPNEDVNKFGLQIIALKQ
ncbi:MAG: DUF3850 domain-containing protein [Patescibacteria group bacterium]